MGMVGESGDDLDPVCAWTSVGAAGWVLMEV